MLLGTARPEAPSDTRHDGDPGSWMAPPAGAADRDPRPPRPVPRAPPRLKPARSNGRAPSRHVYPVLFLLSANAAPRWVPACAAARSVSVRLA